MGRQQHEEVRTRAFEPGPGELADRRLPTPRGASVPDARVQDERIPAGRHTWLDLSRKSNLIE